MYNVSEMTKTELKNNMVIGFSQQLHKQLTPDNIDIQVIKDGEKIEFDKLRFIIDTKD